MATIKTFEELQSWQKGRELVKAFNQVVRKGNFSKDQILVNQMYRATVSIMANLAEGFERNGNKEFKQYAYIAKASAGEFRSLLYITSDGQLLTETQYKELHNLVTETGNLISGIIQYLNKSEFKGNKFSEEEELYQIQPSAKTDFEL
jgi:four helix bundle protein